MSKCERSYLSIRTSKYPNDLVRQLIILIRTGTYSSTETTQVRYDYLGPLHCQHGQIVILAMNCIARQS